MVELYENEQVGIGRASSKGNQLKWRSGDRWYKADYTGYEGLSEYIVSGLLRFSDLRQEEYIPYRTEEIRYRETTYLGCASENFLPEGWQMFTLERLFGNCYGESLNEQIYRISDVKERIRFLVEQTERMTGLRDFGAYLSKMFALDALSLNEDRHTHNVAVLMDSEQNFHYCPFFDHGAALLADTTMDYPLKADPYDCIRLAKAKTVCPDFNEQLDAAEELYGQQVRFSFDRKDIVALLEREPYYSQGIKGRVEQILAEQKRKYPYLFQD